jgi:hypothetical protein
MDLIGASEAVAAMLATGAVQGLGADAARRAIAEILARVRAVFADDPR